VAIEDFCVVGLFEGVGFAFTCVWSVSDPWSCASVIESKESKSNGPKMYFILKLTITFGARIRSLVVIKRQFYHEIAFAVGRFYPEAMTELDEVWNRMLADAAKSAKAQGRGDVAEYLSLKAANDMIRSAGVKWLFDSALEIAAAADRTSKHISIERVEPFNFPYRGANIVGSQLKLIFGVRCLSVDAGWTRTPSDGFMPGGPLAVARLRHFGMPKANAELLLLKDDATVTWAESGADRDFTTERLRDHFLVFLGG